MDMTLRQGGRLALLLGLLTLTILIGCSNDIIKVSDPEWSELCQVELSAHSPVVVSGALLFECEVISFTTVNFCGVQGYVPRVFEMHLRED